MMASVLDRWRHYFKPGDCLLVMRDFSGMKAGDLLSMCGSSAGFDPHVGDEFIDLHAAECDFRIYQHDALDVVPADVLRCVLVRDMQQLQDLRNDRLARERLHQNARTQAIDIARALARRNN